MRNIVLVDTGFLIALFDVGDTLHDSAKMMLKALEQRSGTWLKTVWPVIVETCFFLGPKGKSAFLHWIERGAVVIRPIEITDLAMIIATLNRYADQRIDFADACLIWLAGQEKTQRILTSDRRDFSIYRTPDGRAFEREWLGDES